MFMKRLAGQTAVYGISSIVARLLNYLLTPYLTRIMTTAQYGVITDIYALIPFAMIVLTMGMETGYFKFAGEAQSPQDKRRIFATTWGAVTALSILFLVAAWLFTPQLAAAMDYSATPSYIWVTAAIIALDAITAIPFARLREQGRAMRFVVVRVFSVVINLGFCLFFYSLLPQLASAGGFFASIYDPAYGAGYVFIANLISSLFTLFVLLPSCDKVLPRIDRRLFRTILLYSLPLLVSGIAGTANEFIDRQMIKYLMPTGMAMSALGIYGAVVKIGVVMVLFTQMYRLAAEPFFLSGFKKEEFTQTNAEAMKYFIIVSILIFLGITLFADLFALIVGANFREGMYILPVVLIANMLSGVVLNLSFWYKKTGATRWAIVVTGVGLIFTFVLNYLLVPRLGYYGAALARMGCETTMVIVSLWLNRHFCPTPYPWRRILSYLALGAVLYGVGLLSGSWSFAPRYLTAIVLLCIFVGVVSRTEKIHLGSFVKNALHRK